MLKDIAIPPSPTRENNPASNKFTSVVTILGGAAAFGLIGAVAAPAIPLVAVLAAGVGLLGGLVATKLDKR
jgi:hypothetical protein